jgi:hypothetical protein
MQCLAAQRKYEYRYAIDTTQRLQHDVTSKRTIFHPSLVRQLLVSSSLLTQQQHHGGGHVAVWSPNYSVLSRPTIPRSDRLFLKAACLQFVPPIRAYVRPSAGPRRDSLVDHGSSPPPRVPVVEGHGFEKEVGSIASECCSVTLESLFSLSVSTRLAINKVLLVCVSLSSQT